MPHCVHVRKGGGYLGFLCCCAKYPLRGSLVRTRDCGARSVFNPSCLVHDDIPVGPDRDLRGDCFRQVETLPGTTGSLII